MTSKYQVLTWSHYQSDDSRVLMRDGAPTLAEARHQLARQRHTNAGYPLGRFTAEIVRVGSVEWQSTLNKPKS